MVFRACCAALRAHRNEIAEDISEEELEEIWEELPKKNATDSDLSELSRQRLDTAMMACGL